MKLKPLLSLLVLALVTGSVFSAVAKKPDLTVSKLRVDSSKTAKTGEVKIIYEVKNIGKAAAPASLAKLSIKSDKNRVHSTPSVPSLSPGATYVGEAVYKVTSKKNVVFKMTADYDNKINETNEINNQNSVSFSFGKAF
ncbi:MAG: CARDB domain-containing protein [Candidatus Margulisiibacteriota bacterium]